MTSILTETERQAFREIDVILSGQDRVGPDVVDFIQHLQTQQSHPTGVALHIAEELILLRNQDVYLFTGFVVPGRYPYGENDGPLGTLALTRALHRAGLIPTIWVDPQLMDNALWLAAELGVAQFVRPVNLEDLAQLRHVPAAAIAIEKPGRNARGILHTFDGEAIHGGSIPIDELFLQWHDAATLTLGIGDRGNEIGFGGLRHVIEERLPSSARCHCGCGGGVVSATPANLVLPAAVSNWGAYGLAAAMAILIQDDALLLDPAEERRLLQVAAVRGCVDGIQQRGTFGIDGLSGEISVDVVRALQAIAMMAIAKKKKEEKKKNACA